MSRRFLSWKRGALAACLLLLGSYGLMVGLSGCMSLGLQEAEVIAHFESRGQEVPVFYEHKDSEGLVFVVRCGMGPSVVFVHGSPGRWDNFVSLLSDVSFKSRFTLAAVDRPGFGQSLPEGPEPSLSIQAKRIYNAVSESGISLPAIWVGHSFGGPVVTQLAVDYPAAVSGLLLIAPSMDPELEKRRWFNWVGKFPLVKWGLSRAWRNSNEEIFPLKRELKALQPYLEELEVQTIVLQGDRDRLVPPANADYVKREMPAGVVDLRILEEGTHFIPWSHPELVIQAVADLQERIEVLESENVAGQ